MSDDPLIRQLSKFTPNSDGLDRDALLVAAGRASARPNRRWQILAGALVTAQLATLGLILIRGAMSSVPPLDHKTESTVIVQESLPSDSKKEIPDISEAWLWREEYLFKDGSLPHYEITEPVTPDEPPRRFFGTVPLDLLDNPLN